MLIWVLNNKLRETLPDRWYAGLIILVMQIRWYLIKGRMFEGNAVYCPCCNKYFSVFEKVKPSRVANIDILDLQNSCRCPYCRAIPRQRIVCDYLDKNKQSLFYNPKAKNKALLFAPAPGLRIWFRRNSIKYISADLVCGDIKMDIQAIPFGDNELDFISCDHVLEHVTDYNLALKELFRVIKPGGTVEITVPLLPEYETTYEDAAIVTKEQRRLNFGQSDHLRIFGMDFGIILQDIGFQVVIYDGDTCDERIVPVVGAANFDYNKVFICKKAQANTDTPRHET